MQGFSGKQIDKSIFANQCEVAYGKFLPDIHPNEAIGVKYSCENKCRQNIITCKDKALKLFLKEVKGLKFNIRLTQQLGRLPNYIPILDYHSALKIRLPDSIEYVGISIKDIIKSGFSYKAGRIHEADNISYRSSLLEHNLKSKKVILFLTGEDTIIEGIWHKRTRSKFFETIEAMNFYAVTGINFSVFGDECALAQILNLKRSLFSACLLKQNKINCIPHIYTLNNFQTNRWIDWFNKNPSIKYFTINCQFDKSRADMYSLLQRIKYILTEAPRLHVILQGFRFDYIQYFGTLIERVHFAEKKAIKYSMGNRRLHYDSYNQVLSTTRLNKTSKDGNNKLIISNILARKKQIDDCLKY